MDNNRFVDIPDVIQLRRQANSHQDNMESTVDNIDNNNTNEEDEEDEESDESSSDEGADSE